jgi:hypothetical protein
MVDMDCDLDDFDDDLPAAIPQTHKPVPAKTPQPRSIWDALEAHGLLDGPIPEPESSLPTPLPASKQLILRPPTTQMPSSPIQDALAYYEAKREASTPIRQVRYSPPAQAIEAREACRRANVEADNAVSQIPFR